MFGFCAWLAIHSLLHASETMAKVEVELHPAVAVAIGLGLSFYASLDASLDGNGGVNGGVTPAVMRPVRVPDFGSMFDLIPARLVTLRADTHTRGAPTGLAIHSARPLEQFTPRRVRDDYYVRLHRTRCRR